MDPISRLSDILKTLRLRLSETDKNTKKQAGSALAQKQAVDHAEVETITELRHKIHDKFKRINLSTPDGMDTAKDVFLQIIFSRELGDQVLLDHKTILIIQKVKSTIEADEIMNRELIDLITLLNSNSTA